MSPERSAIIAATLVAALAFASAATTWLVIREARLAIASAQRTQCEEVCDSFGGDKR